MADEAPLVVTKTSQLDAVGAGNDAQAVVCEAPFAASVSRVTYTPSATVTGANTNSRTLTVTERGATGVATTNVATLALVAGVNAPADAEKPLTLSAAANLVVAAGDILTFESTHVGTGIADPGGQVLIEFTRTGTGA